MAKEPIPTKNYLVPLGSFFLSAGNTLLYQVISGPMCRIYWQRYDDSDLSESARDRLDWVTDTEGHQVAITPWKTESAWYEKSPDNWTRNGANYPSYICRLICPHTTDIIGEPIEITVRWIPIQSPDSAQLITVIKEKLQQCQPQRPELLNLSPTQILKMRQLV